MRRTNKQRRKRYQVIRNSQHTMQYITTQIRMKKTFCWSQQQQQQVKQRILVQKCIMLAK